MTQRNTEWPQMWVKKNTGWSETFSVRHKISYSPHQPDQLLNIDYVTIDKTESGLFTCSVMTGKYYRAQQIEDKYISLGGLPDDISNVLGIENPKIRIFRNRSAQEVGKILLALNSFHEFDRASKENLLEFVGLTDFPMPTPPVARRGGCTIL